MEQLQFLNLNSSESEPPEPVLPGEKIAALLVFLIFCCTFMSWWPTFANFARYVFIFVCPAFYPSAYVVFGLRQQIGKRRFWQTLIGIVVIHGAALVTAGYVFGLFPNGPGIRGYFLFTCFEIVLMNLLFRATLIEDLFGLHCLTSLMLEP